MPWLESLLWLLAAMPVAMFAAHALIYRALDLAGARPTAHSSAFAALTALFVPACAVAWQLDVPFCGFAYLTIAYAALAVLYVDVVNIAETSLHMHVLLELAWGGGAPIADLVNRYGADRMVTARLERLASIGHVRIADGRCYIANRSTLYLAAALDVWRRVLGLPGTPPQLAPEPPAAVRSGR